MAIVIKSNDLKFIKGHLNMIKSEDDTFFKIQGSIPVVSEGTVNLKFKENFLESPAVKLKTPQFKDQEIKSLEDII